MVGAFDRVAGTRREVGGDKRQINTTCGRGLLAYPIRLLQSKAERVWLDVATHWGPPRCKWTPRFAVIKFSFD
ncbi:hypothetical protein PoB_006341900 [Plakobranchus ocellatus]|uniref:Uncharacterized protein n=1 Tax=Plakobranchus ocellatus TaxID=259542 RepID=A0AAV4CYB4_9GAST|nr:hypothetical protein PoB_006341900 [Plakobranchus ocellatus]